MLTHGWWRQSTDYSGGAGGGYGESAGVVELMSSAESTLGPLRAGLCPACFDGLVAAVVELRSPTLPPNSPRTRIDSDLARSRSACFEPPWPLAQACVRAWVGSRACVCVRACVRVCE